MERMIWLLSKKSENPSKTCKVTPTCSSFNVKVRFHHHIKNKVELESSWFQKINRKTVLIMLQPISCNSIDDDSLGKITNIPSEATWRLSIVCHKLRSAYFLHVLPLLTQPRLLNLRLSVLGWLQLHRIYIHIYKNIKLLSSMKWVKILVLTEGHLMKRKNTMLWLPKMHQCSMGSWKYVLLH